MLAGSSYKFIVQHEVHEIKIEGEYKKKTVVGTCAVWSAPKSK